MLSDILNPFKSSNSGYYRPPIMDDTDILDKASLRDAIIYLEKYAEDMEMFSGCINVAGKTRTEIEEINIRQKERVAPFRKAIKILKEYK